MTVTSVTSLSVDPPTLIVGINLDASSFPLVKRHGRYVAVDQHEDAARLAEFGVPSRGRPAAGCGLAFLESAI